MPGNGDGPDERPQIGETTGGSDPDRPRYLFPIDGDHPRDVLELVCDLVADADADLVLAAPVTEGSSPSGGTIEAREEAHRRAATLVWHAKETCQGDLSIERVVRVGTDRERVLEEIVDAFSVSTIVSEDRPRSGRSSPLQSEGDNGGSFPRKCDSITVTGIEYIDAIDSVLEPIAGGPHSGMAIDVGLALARQHDASLELLHVHEPGDEAREAGAELLEHGMDRVADYENADGTVQESTEVQETILDHTSSFDVTVLGAPREGLIRRFVFGTVPDEVDARADRTILTAHRGGVSDSWLDRLS
ncbi:MAG: universal stress protein [Halanaeroarchaeum sp.]